MKTDRPVNLNLFTISFPFVAIVSIRTESRGRVVCRHRFCALCAATGAGVTAGFCRGAGLVAQPLGKFICLRGPAVRDGVSRARGAQTPDARLSYGGYVRRSAQRIAVVRRGRFGTGYGVMGAMLW